MPDQLEFKIINLGVAYMDLAGGASRSGSFVKLRDRPASTRVPALELNHFASQLDSPGLIQRFPSYLHSP